MSKSDRVTLSEREDLERLHNAFGDVPEPEDVRPGENPAVTEEREFQMEQVAAQITDEQRDKEIADLKREMERQNEIIHKLLASGRNTPEEIASQLSEHEMMMQRRKLYDRIRAHGNKVRIVIYSHSDPKQNRPVKGSHNGVKFELPRNQTVAITAEILEVLDNAVSKTEEHILDAHGNPQLVCNRVPSYPFHIADHEFMEAV